MHPRGLAISDGLGKLTLASFSMSDMSFAFLLKAIEIFLTPGIGVGFTVGILGRVGIVFGGKVARRDIFLPSFPRRGDWSVVPGAPSLCLLIPIVKTPCGEWVTSQNITCSGLIMMFGLIRERQSSVSFLFQKRLRVSRLSRFSTMATRPFWSRERMGTWRGCSLAPSTNLPLTR